MKIYELKEHCEQIAVDFAAGRITYPQMQEAFNDTLTGAILTGAIHGTATTDTAEPDNRQATLPVIKRYINYISHRFYSPPGA